MAEQTSNEISTMSTLAEDLAKEAQHTGTAPAQPEQVAPAEVPLVLTESHRDFFVKVSGIACPTLEDLQRRVNAMPEGIKREFFGDYARYQAQEVAAQSTVSNIDALASAVGVSQASQSFPEVSVSVYSAVHVGPNEFRVAINGVLVEPVRLFNPITITEELERLRGTLR